MNQNDAHLESASGRVDAPSTASLKAPPRHETRGHVAPAARGARTRAGFARLRRFRCLSLILLVTASTACFGQRQNDPRPVPLDPVEAAQEGRTLVDKLLTQRPAQTGTNTGRVKIRDSEGKEREIPVRFEVTSTSSNWVSRYETLPSAGGFGGQKLTIIHTGAQPNRYELSGPVAAGTSNLVARQLPPHEIMAPFADSDFWIADLGLEFLHWPKQRLLKKTMRHSKSCNVLESINPAPVPGGYARVVAWIMIESPYGIVHADAYDARGEVLKRFDPVNIEKIQGEYQLEEVEMRNRKTDSHTWIKFNLSDKAARELGQPAQPVTRP